MKIKITSCVATTTSGSRCRKQPMSGGKHCVAHSASRSALRSDLRRRRATREAQDRESQLNYWQNNPERCPRCKIWDECYCAINLELCVRCMRHECYCRCLSCRGWADDCSCVSSTPQAFEPMEVRTSIVALTLGELRSRLDSLQAEFNLTMT